MANRYEAIRAHYDLVTPVIFEAAKYRINGWASPYSRFIDWTKLFSPIEDLAWQAIRWFGMAPFYPQYPVAGYFLDFANPVVKVGIECDGVEFHKDKEKDRKRDLKLFEHGWKIYRLTGADCVRPIIDEYWEMDRYDAYDKAEILRLFYSKSIEGLLKALALYYFGYQSYYDEPDEFGIAMDCLANRVSLKDKVIHMVATGNPPLIKL